MRTRKKPDLRLDIPSYRHDYVEMPPETRRLIHEANKTPNDIQYIDDDNKPAIGFQVGSPLSPSKFGFRSSTPEIKISEPEDDANYKKEQTRSPSENEDSPVVSDRLKHYQKTTNQNNVSSQSLQKKH